MVFDSVSGVSLLRRECVPLAQVTQSKAAMTDTDFYRLHRKYCNTDVANAGKPEDCGQPNAAKSLETPKLPKHNNTGKEKGFL